MPTNIIEILNVSIVLVNCSKVVRIDSKLLLFFIKTSKSSTIEANISPDLVTFEISSSFGSFVKLIINSIKLRITSK